MKIDDKLSQSAAILSFGHCGRGRPHAAGTGTSGTSTPGACSGTCDATATAARSGSTR